MSNLEITAASSADTFADTPFHSGERAVQQRVGVLEKMATRGQLIRSFMPDQHRDFFQQLPFMIVGSVDRRQQPWASIVTGAPGFVTSPDAGHLAIHAPLLPADPLQQTLVEHAAIGLLGIEPHTRRRNRMNGKVEKSDAAGWTLKVEQSFGNCPKYIQARRPSLVEDADAAAPVVHRSGQLDSAMQKLIAASDTFFIATAYFGKPVDESAVASTANNRQHGVDVSHRGGKPGFVRIDDEKTLTVPDFVGNFFFNTIGNLVEHPRAGLLFIDFVSGDLLYLAVSAELIWDGPEVAAFKGAERLLRFHVEQAIRVEASLPLRWSEAELSPALAPMGSWQA
ncbi:pyridoxamine 5'-phosphate oxidase family protein [Collimonas sp.]|jgi:predicted pyridoxine 5'-phosphate oxidase superfamily flavin-nucleotide-binding protein|uniref:pyridoxamine 5'-phosphate oxidase family protein n=1 Tax=Collimonas sp. TaxID=1963772 RepID=UPI002C5A4C23|nr:pyridoxamine 5'-phosphate oxidase family protein [Collimonas sp.]HWW05741.1 pyridoxamine 5'-phosphate oxidase family protein [Collimonas sp.]